MKKCLHRPCQLFSPAARPIDQAVVVVLDEVWPLEQRVVVEGTEQAQQATDLAPAIATRLRDRLRDARLRRLFTDVVVCDEGKRGN